MISVLIRILLVVVVGTEIRNDMLETRITFVNRDSEK